MTRKGYRSEYRAKKALQLQYGEHNVLKLPNWVGLSDFMVVSGDSPVIQLMVEVKEFHPTLTKKKYYPTPWEVKQHERTRTFCLLRKIRFERWVWMPRKPFNKEVIIQPHLGV